MAPARPLSSRRSQLGSGAGARAKWPARGLPCGSVTSGHQAGLGLRGAGCAQPGTGHWLGGRFCLPWLCPAPCTRQGWVIRYSPGFRTPEVGVRGPWLFPSAPSALCSRPGVEATPTSGEGPVGFLSGRRGSTLGSVTRKGTWLLPHPCSGGRCWGQVAGESPALVAAQELTTGGAGQGRSQERHFDVGAPLRHRGARCVPPHRPHLVLCNVLGSGGVEAERQVGAC